MIQRRGGADVRDGLRRMQRARTVLDGAGPSHCGSAPDRIRTCDLVLRRHALYPTELRAQYGKRISRVLSPARPEGIISLGRRLLDGSSSLPGAVDTLRRRRRGPRLAPAWPCSGWGLPCRSPLPGARCALTAPFHPCLCPCGPSAVCSLLHCPSPHDARPLAGTLPCGARTFLDRRNGRPRSTLASHFKQRGAPGGAPSAPGRSRTPSLRIRSPTLYPVELRARGFRRVPSFEW